MDRLDWLDAEIGKRSPSAAMEVGFVARAEIEVLAELYRIEFAKHVAERIRLEVSTR